FFQAEDGIRDGHVTGVQTCALPICAGRRAGRRPKDARPGSLARRGAARPGSYAQRRVPTTTAAPGAASTALSTRFTSACSSIWRSEERRVGKEWRARRWREPERKTV